MPTPNLCPSSPSRSFMIAGAAALAGLGVALGAFGAHALRPTLEVAGRLETWETAVRYQLVHALALLVLGIWSRVDPTGCPEVRARWVGGFWSAGIACFSGSLYALCLGGPQRLLWPVTPLGGLLFLIGWATLAVTTVRDVGKRPTSA